jgi:hypothetical protein
MLQGLEQSSRLRDIYQKGTENCENKLFGLDGEEKKYSERFFTIKDNIKFRNKNMVPRRIFFLHDLCNINYVYR